MSMPPRVRLSALLPFLTFVAGCGPSPEASPQSDSVDERVIADEASSANASFLDPAKRSSRDCGTVASYYVQALRSDLYAAAADVWKTDAAVTASGLREQFRDIDRATMRVGDIQIEGAAGSLYCAARIDATRGDERLSGVLTLHRANDVPGATADQLLWTIEQSTLN